MAINPAVVNALMALKNVAPSTLARLVHVPQADLQAWLSGALDDSDERVPVGAQLEVLSILGVRDTAPRNDVVHFWQVRERAFASVDRIYWALQSALKAFGPAQVVHIARERDPLICVTAKAYFGLRFAEFVAILEVQTTPLRAFSFNPERMADLSWAPGVPDVLVPDNEYLRLEPGSLKVRSFTQYLGYATQVAQWDKLRDSAISHGISAEKLAVLLAGPQAGALRLTSDFEPPFAPAPVVAPGLQTGGGAPTKASSETDLFSVPLAASPP